MDATKWIELGTTYGVKVIGVVIALFVAWLVAKWASNATRRNLEKRDFDKTLARFFANMVRYLILIAAVLGCLGVFGIQTASFAAVLAAAGFAVGMAFQNTLSNFSAGVMLLVFRPFKVGDYVHLAGTDGVCEQIDLFTCEFRSPNNRKLIIPNSEIFGKVIDNYTAYDTRRVDVNVGCEYSADLDATRKVLEDAIQTIEGMIKEPPPQVFLKELGDSSVNWQMRVWCKTEDYWAVHQETIRVTKQALDKAEIGIPFPQTDVHLDESVVKALTN